MLLLLLLRLVAASVTSSVTSEKAPLITLVAGSFQ